MTIQILDTIPFVLGGALTSTALVLNNRFSEKMTQPSTSLSSMFTMDNTMKWRSSFVAGILFIASLVASHYGFEEVGNTHLKPFESERMFFKGTGIFHFMFSGLLVGLGAKLAQGSLTKFSFTGIPRFNGQSLIAAAVVFIFGAATATLRSSFSILQGLNVTRKFNEHLDWRLSLFIPLLILGFNLLRNFNDTNAVKGIFKSFGFGALFGLGLMLSGFGRRHQVLDFLSLNSHWNPFFLFVILGAVLANMFWFRTGFPDLKGERLPAEMTFRMLLGSALFGIGLGISGLTPGSGLLVSSVYLPQVILFYLPFIALGSFGVGMIDRVLFGKTKGKVE